jgi:ribosome recycling factor
MQVSLFAFTKTSMLRLALQNFCAILPTRSTQCAIRPVFVSQRPLFQRSYATKGKAKSTAQLVPGSQQPITDEAALAEYKKAEATMTSAVDWFRKECQGLETRASGRVTPALLSPVRVKLKDRDYKLEEIATVGVRDNSILLVTIFDEKVSGPFTETSDILTCSSRT